MAAEQQQPFPTFSPTEPIDPRAVNTSLVDSSSPQLQQPPPPPSSSSADSMFSIQTSQQDHINFAHPFPHSSSFPDNNQSTDARVDHPQFPISLPPPQMNSSIGPSRVLTRRQARAAQQQQQLQHLGITLPNHNMQQGLSSEKPLSAFFLPSELSRPRTPNSYASQGHFSEQSDMTVSINPSAIQTPMASPAHPSTPASTSSNFSHFSFHPYASHSRSTSSSTNHRSASPAASVMSVATSMSSCSSSRFPIPPISDGMSPIDPRSKQKKQRLFNVDRKAICLWTQKHPNARQEDVAKRWGVERSTISKILKHKTKWLSIPEGEELKVAKHRPSKFPEIETRLQAWLILCKENSTTITDSMIRSKAKEAAKDMGIDEDKFKASAGWVENFKHRHGIRKGVWTGDGRNRRASITAGGLRPPSEGGNRPASFITELEGSKSLQRLSNEQHDLQLGNMGPPPLVEVKDGKVMNLDQPLTLSPQHPVLEPSPLPRTPWDDQQQQMMMVNSGFQVDESLSVTPVPQQSQSSAEHVGLSQNDVGEQHSQGTMSQQNCDPLPNGHPHEGLESMRMQEIPEVAFADGHFHPVAPGPSVFHRVTPQEANEAVDKLLMFFNTLPQDYLSPEERNFLTGLRQSVWCAANGIPGSRTRSMQGPSDAAWAA